MVISPEAIKLSQAIGEQTDSRAKPHILWPEVQPFPKAAPNPTSRHPLAGGDRLDVNRFAISHPDKQKINDHAYFEKPSPRLISRVNSINCPSIGLLT